jgi:hypothetical protein
MSKENESSVLRVIEQSINDKLGLDVRIVHYKTQDDDKMGMVTFTWKEESKINSDIPVSQQPFLDDAIEEEIDNFLTREPVVRMHNIYSPETLKTIQGQLKSVPKIPYIIHEKEPTAWVIQESTPDLEDRATFTINPFDHKPTKEEIEELKEKLRNIEIVPIITSPKSSTDK